MRGFSSDPHGILIRARQIGTVHTLSLPRATLALLIVAVLLAGVFIGSVLPTLRAEQASATPSPTVAATEPVESQAGELPGADVPGEDLERLPRYPGSVRSEYEASRDDDIGLTALEFLADATVDDVRTFYQGVIVEHGWQRADIAYSGGEWTYVLVDGDIEALVEIEETGGLVEIDLVVSEPLPSVTPTSRPTPAPTAQPTPAPTPPPPPAPPPDDDDDGGDDDDDGGDDDGGGDD